MKTESKLEKILAAGHLAVTGECGPPRGANGDKVREKSKYRDTHNNGVLDCFYAMRCDASNDASRNVHKQSSSWSRNNGKNN